MGRHARERRSRRGCTNQAGDDDGGGDAQTLDGAIDCLNWLLALELLDQKWMAIDAAHESQAKVSAAADS